MIKLSQNELAKISRIELINYIEKLHNYIALQDQGLSTIFRIVNLIKDIDYIKNLLENY